MRMRSLGKSFKVRPVRAVRNKSGQAQSDMIVKNERYKSYMEIPGPKSYPVIGTLYTYLPFIGEYSAEALHKNAILNWNRYGPLVRESLMPGTTVIHVYDPHDIESVFRQEGKLPERRSHLAMLHYRMSKSSTYNTGGLIATNGPEWWRLRSTFQKNFTSPKSVRYHVPSTDEVVRKFIQYVKKKRLSSRDDFLNYINRLNLEIIGRVAFGTEFNCFSDEEQKRNSKTNKIISSAFDSNSGVVKLDKGFLWRIFKTPLYRKLAKSQTYLESVTHEILINKIKFYKKKNEGTDTECRSLLDSFLQQPDVDLKDITGMMVDILMASIDTTSYTLSFMLYHLARNPRCQQEAYEQAKELLPNEDQILSAEILSKANYIRNCVKESLRLNPVSIGVGRIIQKDIVLRGYLIPKNSVIVAQNMTSSNLPQYVKNPQTFNPKRWQRDSDLYENLNPFLSLPFGFGPRSCIARRLAEQNIYVTVLRLVREFELKWDGGELGIRTHLINKPNQPINLRLIPRISN